MNGWDILGATLLSIPCLLILGGLSAGVIVLTGKGFDCLRKAICREDKP